MIVYEMAAHSWIFVGGNVKSYTVRQSERNEQESESVRERRVEEVSNAQHGGLLTLTTVSIN